MKSNLVIGKRITAVAQEWIYDYSTNRKVWVIDHIELEDGTRIYFEAMEDPARSVNSVIAYTAKRTD